MIKKVKKAFYLHSFTKNFTALKADNNNQFKEVEHIEVINEIIDYNFYVEYNTFKNYLPYENYCSSRYSNFRTVIEFKIKEKNGFCRLYKIIANDEYNAIRINNLFCWATNDYDLFVEEPLISQDFFPERTFKAICKDEDGEICFKIE